MSDQSALGDRRVRQLPSRWARLLPDSVDLGRQLIARYSEPSRRYHDVRHLAHVLAAVDDLANEADEVEAVQLAAWFHDAVYDVRADDNEEQSARLAELELPLAGVTPARVANVARLVRLTATHAVAVDDHDGAVLCDADLSILSADADGYAAYTAAVREEYAHVPDADFKSGRAGILRELLGAAAALRDRARTRALGGAGAQQRRARDPRADREASFTPAATRRATASPRPRRALRAHRAGTLIVVGVWPRSTPATTGTPSGPSRSRRTPSTTSGSPQSVNAPQTTPRTPSSQPERISWVRCRSIRYGSSVTSSSTTIPPARGARSACRHPC